MGMDWMGIKEINENEFDQEHKENDEMKQSENGDAVDSEFHRIFQKSNNFIDPNNRIHRRMNGRDSAQRRINVEQHIFAQRVQIEQPIQQNHEHYNFPVICYCNNLYPAYPRCACSENLFFAGYHCAIPPAVHPYCYHYQSPPNTVTNQ